MLLDLPHSEKEKGGLASGYGALRHFQQCFNYIVAVSFIGGGNRKAWRKPPTKFIT